MTRLAKYSPFKEYATKDEDKDKTVAFCRIDGNGSLLLSLRPPRKATPRSVVRRALRIVKEAPKKK